MSISDYVIGDKISEGGFGETYRARHKVTGKAVCIKKLKEVDASAVFAEAKSIANFDDHPNIVKVYDAGFENGVNYIAMEFVDGGTLADRLGSLSAEESVSIARGVLSALSYMHERGALHRDIKPSNILFTRNGIPKIADFGLVKSFDLNETVSNPKNKKLLPSEASPPSDSSKWVVGTPAYWAPEKRATGDDSFQTDVWSLGVVFYQMLAGKLPDATCYKPPSAINSKVPYSLDRVIMQALAGSTLERFNTAGEMLEALEAIDLKPNFLRRAVVLAKTAHAFTKTVHTLTLLLSLAGGTYFGINHLPSKDHTSQNTVQKKYNPHSYYSKFRDFPDIKYEILGSKSVITLGRTFGNDMPAEFWLNFLKKADRFDGVEDFTIQEDTIEALCRR